MESAIENASLVVQLRVQWKMQALQCKVTGGIDWYWLDKVTGGLDWYWLDKVTGGLDWYWLDKVTGGIDWTRLLVV